MNQRQSVISVPSIVFTWDQQNVINPLWSRSHLQLLRLYNSVLSNSVTQLQLKLKAVNYIRPLNCDYEAGCLLFLQD